MADLGQLANVLGMGLLAGAGPSGRGVAGNLLNQQRAIAFREKEMEADRLRQEQEDLIKKQNWFRTLASETVKNATDPKVVDEVLGFGQRMNLLTEDEANLMRKSSGIDLGYTKVDTLQDGKPVTKIVQNAPGTYEREPSKPLVELHTGEKGLSASDISNMIEQQTNDRIAVDQFTNSIDQVIGFVQSENYVGGFSGKAISALNSAYQQVQQTLDKRDNLVINGKFNVATIDADLSEENTAFLRKAAISNDLRTSAIAKMAFVLAKRLDPNGRISNQDVDAARNIISGSADQASALYQLQNLRDLTIQDFNSASKTRASVLGKGQEGVFSPVEVKNVAGQKKDPADMTDEELLDF